MQRLVFAMCVAACGTGLLWLCVREPWMAVCAVAAGFGWTMHDAIDGRLKLAEQAEENQDLKAQVLSLRATMNMLMQMHVQHTAATAESAHLHSQSYEQQHRALRPAVPISPLVSAVDAAAHAAGGGGGGRLRSLSAQQQQRQQQQQQQQSYHQNNINPHRRPSCGGDGAAAEAAAASRTGSSGSSSSNNNNKSLRQL